jgi:quercetin dioxygenase-like cupin family protein
VMTTLSDTIERLNGEGFTAHLGVVGNRLRAFESGETFEAGEVMIREYQRFEGVSNPDDMAIVYAIESLNGMRGSLVDAFGVYSDPKVSAFLQDVPIRRTGQSAPAVHDVGNAIPRRRGESETIMVNEWKARSDRPVTVPLLHVRLGAQLERFKEESTWRTSGRDAITLTKESALRLVLMLLSKGTKLAEHKTPGPMVLHVLSGSVIFRAGSRAETAGSGELIVLESAIEHEVEATEDSACLLTLGGRFHPGQRPTG